MLALGLSSAGSIESKALGLLGFLCRMALNETFPGVVVQRWPGAHGPAHVRHFPFSNAAVAAAGLEMFVWLPLGGNPSSRAWLISFLQSDDECEGFSP